MLGIISRKYGKEQTTGSFVVFDGDIKVFESKTLEPQYNHNEKGNSCIYAGDYIAKKITSPTYGKCFEISDVHGRTDILIHWGNYRSNTKGCVLLGSEFKDINNDGLKDVINSKKTFDKFMELTESQIKIIIR